MTEIQLGLEIPFFILEFFGKQSEIKKAAESDPTTPTPTPTKAADKTPKRKKTIKSFCSTPASEKNGAVGHSVFVSKYPELWPKISRKPKINLKR